MAWAARRFGGAPAPVVKSAQPVDVNAEIRKAVAAVRAEHGARLAVLKAELEKVAAARSTPPPGSPWRVPDDVLAGRAPGAPLIKERRAD